MAQTGEPPPLKPMIYKIIRKMTEVSQVKLQPELAEFLVLRNVVKTSRRSIAEVVATLFDIMHSNCPLRRHATLLLIDYLFKRSHHLRLEVVERIQEFLSLVCETDPLHQPLPPPKNAADALKTAGIKIVKAWHEKYGIAYSKLDFVSSHLKASKSVDFDRATAELLAERQRKDVEDRQTAIKQEKVVIGVMNRFDDIKVDMQRSLNEAESALLILVPPFAEDNETSSLSLPREEKERLHACSAKDTISIVVMPEAPSIQVSPENETVLQAIRDARVMLERYSKTLTHWLKKLGVNGASGDEVKALLEFKQKLNNAGAKVDELKIVSLPNPKELDSDSEDSDMEDVPEKQLEDFEQPYEVPKYLLDSIAASEAAEQPSCSSYDPPGASPFVHSTANVAGKSAIPTVPYGLDLKYWGEKRGDVEEPRNNFDGHRFWRPPNEDQVSMVQPSVYETRLITFVGKELRPKRECRYPMNNGQLCPRRDLKNCPVHGFIYNRDTEGTRTDYWPTSLTYSPLGSNTGNDGDEELLRDIDGAIGTSLSEKSKRPKKKEPKGLSGRTVRERLQTKLFDRRAMKRVGKTLDDIQKAKIKKKHGGQFVHSLDR